MQYTENIDKSTSVANEVMERIAQEKLSPTPEVFSLWYAYYSGLHPEICSQLDKLHQADKITMSECKFLHDKYLTNKHEQQILEETSEKIQVALDELTQLLSLSGVSQNKYNKKLIEKSGKISKEGDVTVVAEIVQALIQDTQSMIEQNQRLETRLNETSIEMEEMHQNMESLKQEAMTDALTGLANRKCFEAELKLKASEALDTGKSLCVVMVDIDNFKIFNDTFGHQVGDQVLKLVARSLTEGIKGQDMAARYGGEEFIIVLPNTSLNNAEKVANTLRERIAAKDIINQAKGEKLGRLSISLGVAQLHPGESMMSLIERSDRALYKAKASGKNCVIVLEYSNNLHSEQDEEIIIETK